MSILTRLSRTASAQSHDAGNTARQAQWLLTPYEMPVWTVADSRGGADTVTLSFEMRMPDGRCLTEWSEFYCAVREFAFLVRDGRYSDVNDAERHTEYVYALMDIVYGLALRGFTSFRRVSRKYLNGEFLDYIVHGTDALLSASERASDWLEVRDKSERRGFQDGLPLYRRPDGTTLRMLDNARLMQMMGLPASACKLPRVAFVCNEAAREAGLRVQVKPRESFPPLGTLTKTSIYRFLRALSMLYEMSDDMHAASLPEPPFENASALAERRGIDGKPTPLPPPSLALHLLSRAMVWVANYSDDLLRLLRDAEEVANAKGEDGRITSDDMASIVKGLPTSGPVGSPWPLLPRARAKAGASECEHLSCAQAIRFLFMACRIVITTFSARRADEIDDLEADDLDGDDKAWWLRPYIQKTLQRKDWIPVPDIVAQAFKVLLALSSSARRMTETSYVFQWWNPFESDKNKVVKGVAQDGDDIDKFALWVETPAWAPKGKTPTTWHWSWHQFRKFFAVLYFYRYRQSDIAVLAHFLRHFNLEMTREYLLKNKYLKDVFEQVEWSYVVDVSRHIASAGAAVEGGRAKLLFRRMVSWLGRKVRVTGDALEASTEYVARQFRAQKLVVTPKAWVDCTCPRTKQGAASANCRSNTPMAPGIVGPDFERAGPALCLPCPFSIDNGRLKQAVAEEALSVERMFSSDLLKDTVLEGLAKARVVTVFKYEAKRGAVSGEA